MARKTKVVVNDPYWYHDYVYVYYELQFENDLIVPGDKIKFKNTRGDFRFIKLVHNSKKDVTWIDCRDNKTHEERSFYVEFLKCKVKPKRSRRRKVVV